LEANRVVLDAILPGPGPDIRGAVDAGSDIVGKVVVEAGAKILGSHIRGPAIIGTDAVIETSYIGPYAALGCRCIVRNSALESSVM
jgi:glucose-1-phosphate thymidylyltransferase